jgi:hypothetical protein
VKKREKNLTIASLGSGQLVLVIGAVLLVAVVEHDDLSAQK